MQKFIVGFTAAFLMGGMLLLAGFYVSKPQFGNNESVDLITGKVTEIKKSKEELLAEALEKSKEIKGLYMTADVASGIGPGPEKLRNYLLRLATSTEINGLVIDVKEVCGPDYDEKKIKALLKILKENNLWAIARIVTFKDASQFEAHPEWYLKRSGSKVVGNECWNKKHLRALVGSDPTRIIEKEGLTLLRDLPLWRDKRGGDWIDPSSEGARNYILEFSKKMIDFGFDELQYDYIRFPSDGDVQNAIYPAWNGKTPKYEVMKSFFEFLNKNLKEYKPNIILSADLFGYAAIRAGDVGIGQRLDDIGDNFDYISFMVYPSHYYSGLYLPQDPINNLPAINFNASQARKNPGEVVWRSLQFARDFLDGKIGTSTFSYLPMRNATTSAASSSIKIVLEPTPRSKARLRPWLEDFFHEDDQAAKRPFGVEKVRLQIEGAEKVEKSGWLLWNAANIYTEDALKKE